MARRVLANSAGGGRRFKVQDNRGSYQLISTRTVNRGVRCVGLHAGWYRRWWKLVTPTASATNAKCQTSLVGFNHKPARIKSAIPTIETC